MKIEDKNYTIEIVNNLKTIVFTGNLRLHSINDYSDIIEKIFNYIKEQNDSITFDFTKLEFINSSGIASLGILFIKLRDIEIKIKIIASKYVNWHVASLKDFQSLNPHIEIDFVVQH